MTPDWIRITEKAEWRARDSSGELVFRDQMWILGGWFSSFERALGMSGARATEEIGRSFSERHPGSIATCR